MFNVRWFQLKRADRHGDRWSLKYEFNFETVGRMLTSEALVFKYFLEPIVWESQTGSMISNMVHTLQLTAAYYKHAYGFLSSDFQGKSRFERAIMQILMANSPVATDHLNAHARD
jgi:hypothetical protein